MQTAALHQEIGLTNVYESVESARENRFNTTPLTYYSTDV